MSALPTLVISLDVGKFERMQKRAESAGLHQVLHSPGIRATPEDRKGSSPSCQKRCLDTTIGIFLAHRKAWQSIVNNQYPRALILEDDVKFVPNFLSHLQRYLSVDADMVVLGNMVFGKRHYTIWDRFAMLAYSLGSSTGVDHGVYPLKWLMGAHAYILTNEAAQKLLWWLPQPTWHVDGELGRISRQSGGHFRAVGVRPSLIYQSEFHASSQSSMGQPEMHVIDSVPSSYWKNFRFLQVLGQPVTIKNLLLSLLVVLAVVIVGFVLLFRLLRQNWKPTNQQRPRRRPPH